ncbi:MAG: hypothetical protein OEV37_02455 [Candidatus Berkelbacteria bacterium]|nr:hypothetical protein [Candidatus Berkelbacteria bacterium]
MNARGIPLHQPTKNPEKSISRVTINGAMMGSLFLILTLIWTLGPEKFNIYIIAQLVLAIPLLFISGLAYAKVGFRSKIRLFDRFGWITTVLGNNFILNVTGLIAATFSKTLSVIYFSLVFTLILIYYAINVFHCGDSLKEELIKVFVILAIILIGGILPLILM